MLKTAIQYNKEHKDVIISMLKEFPNAIKSLTLKRRKGRSKIEIKDEYDVQDLLSIILKSIFSRVVPE